MFDRAGEQVDPDVGSGQVVPGHREGALEQPLGAVGVGQHHAVVLQPDPPRAGPDIDPVERIAGVADDRFVLLPPVERLEVQHHVTGQVGVGQPEGRVLAVGRYSVSTVSTRPSAVCMANGTLGSSSFGGVVAEADGAVLRARARPGRRAGRRRYPPPEPRRTQRSASAPRSASPGSCRRSRSSCPPDQPDPDSLRRRLEPRAAAAPDIICFVIEMAMTPYCSRPDQWQRCSVRSRAE